MQLQRKYPDTLPVNAKRIRVTERQIFKRCRRQWYLAHWEKLQPIDKKSDARSLGTSLHSALAEYYRHLWARQTGKGLPAILPKPLVPTGPHAQVPAPKDSEILFPPTLPPDMAMWNAWTIAQVGLDDEQIELGTGMLDGYLRFAQQEDAGYKVATLDDKPAVELTFYAPIPDTDIWLQGTCDLLMYNANGLFALDHKGYRTLLTPDQAQFDDQIIAYIWVLRQNGINVRGGYYNQLLKSVPRVPKLLKSGQLSRAANIKTDKRTYTGAVLANNLPLSDYQEFIDELPEIEFFKREPVMKSPRTIESFGENLAAEAKEIWNPATALYPHFQQYCPFCDFKSLCRTMSDKGDVDATKRQLYVVQPGETPIRRES